MRAMETSIDPLRMIHDLDSSRKRAILKVQTKTLNVMVSELVRKGFEWILPVTLAKSTDPLWPDPGASIEKRIEFDIYDERVRTIQSMIIQKLVLASLGPEKFFIISPNIRIESRKRAGTGWHLYEFTQLETEISGGKMHDVFRVYEELIIAAMKAVQDDVSRLRNTELNIPEAPFRVRSRNELQQEYGEVISGAEREYEYPKIVKKLDRDGVRKEDYAFLLSLAKDGKLKPSAGAGLGFERFIAYLCGVKHVAEVQPFPRIPGMVPPV